MIKYEDAPFEFPANVVWVLSAGLERTPWPAGSLTVVRRGLRPVDPNFSIGVMSNDWTPTDHELMGSGSTEPSIARYDLRVMTLVKMAGNEAEAMSLSARLSKSVRSMLYRSEELRLQLHALSEIQMGVREQVQRFGIRSQRFVNNEIAGEFLFVSIIDCYVDTEITRIT